jgi:hypothetical protein
VTGCSHDGNLANDEGTAGEVNEDLKHDHVADGAVGLAEVDHQAHAEDLDWDERQGKVFEPAGRVDDTGFGCYFGFACYAADQRLGSSLPSDYHCSEAGSDVVNIDHRSRIANRQVVHNLQL